MARVELASGVMDDFDRFFDHPDRYQGTSSEGRIDGIVAAIDLLALSPQTGRPVCDGLRELVIGAGARGDVALCRFVPDVDIVFVLAIRRQRESGY